MEDAIYALLTSYPALTAIVGTNVWWYDHEQGSGLPSITLTKVSAVRGYVMSGPDRLAQSRVQFDCDSRTRTQALAIRDALLNCLSGYSGTVAGVEIQGIFAEHERFEFDNTNTDQEINRVSMDFSITHKE